MEPQRIDNAAVLAELDPSTQQYARCCTRHQGHRSTDEDRGGVSTQTAVDSSRSHDQEGEDTRRSKVEEAVGLPQGLGNVLITPRPNGNSPTGRASKPNASVGCFEVTSALRPDG